MEAVNYQDVISGKIQVQPVKRGMQIIALVNWEKAPQKRMVCKLRSAELTAFITLRPELPKGFQIIPIRGSIFDAIEHLLWFFTIFIFINERIREDY